MVDTNWHEHVRERHQRVIGQDSLSGSINRLMAASAHGYASRGWPVLPVWWPTQGGRCACNRSDCGNIGKHPVAHLVPNGLHQATVLADSVHFWWSALPLANIGLRTGAESGIVVLDVDGPAGRESLKALVQRHGHFKAIWARTGSGGWHAYMSHPGLKVPNSAGRLGPHLDVRGDGGYVVAPPSLHASGRRYRWGLELPETLPAPPSWILQPLSPQAVGVSRTRLDRAGLIPYVVAALEGEARAVAVAPAGHRNARLNLASWRLGRLVGAGVVEEGTVVDLLLVAATVAGLGDREARATISSGIRAGVRHPRDVVS